MHKVSLVSPVVHGIVAYFMQILDTLIEPGHDAPEENASILVAICNDAESSEWRWNLRINQEFADPYRLLRYWL